MQLSHSGMYRGTKTITSQLCFIFHTAPLHFMENKAHFVPFDLPTQIMVKYISLHHLTIYCVFSLQLQ